jgi:DNA-binding transcriptional ArsR family regulator
VSLSLVFGPDDAARTRFAISPLFETLAAMFVLLETGRQKYHLPWLDAVRPALEELDLRPLLILTPMRGWTPDFLTPAPPGPGSDIDWQLARLRETPPEQVAHEISRSLTERPTSVPPDAWQLLDDPAATLTRLADLVEECWQLLIAPHWPRLREFLEADVAFRTQTQADYGLEHMLADLNPRIRWRGRSLVIAGLPASRVLLDGQGLLLVPSVFLWPSLAPVIDPPARPGLVYPARGIAELWQPARTGQSDALARLLGRTRAALLESLAEPASTQTLARRHELAPSTVSEHLTALRDARLISGQRRRHAVMYQQTRLGASLADGS